MNIFSHIIQLKSYNNEMKQPPMLSRIKHCLRKPINHALFYLLFMQYVVNGAILPADRVTSWAPGIPGGIPTIQSPYLDVVAAFGAPNDSSADASDAIQKALDSLRVTGGVVYVPPGIYRIDKQLLFNGNRTVLRGAGADCTKLYLGFAGNSFFIGMYGRGEWQPLTDAVKGLTSVTVTDGSAFTVGDFAEIEQINDSALMYTDPAWIVDWAENMVGQLFEVAAVQGTTVTFKTPLHFQIRKDLFPQIRPQRFRTYAGIEDVYLEKTVAEGHTIHIKNAAYCWVKRIESSYTRKAHSETETSLGCLFSENYMHHSFSYGGGGSGYGTSLHTHSTDCLVENNIYEHLRHAMIIQNGATGNVFAYNFSTDPVQGESDAQPLNEGWNPPDISFHGHYAQYNLAEGNIVTEIGISDYWGPMGPGNTFLRNSVRGGDGIVLNDHSHSQNIIGNVMTAWSDDATSQKTLFHGNIVNKAAVQWDSTISEHTLPPSLYLTAKPLFWTDDIPWPGTGSDVVPPGTNPAEQRWKTGNFIPQKVSVNQQLALLKNNPAPQFSISLWAGSLHVALQVDANLLLFDLNGRVISSHSIKKGATTLPYPPHHGIVLILLRTTTGVWGVHKIAP